jgi:hypothetical protein
MSAEYSRSEAVQLRLGARDSIQLCPFRAWVSPDSRSVLRKYCFPVKRLGLKDKGGLGICRVKSFGYLGDVLVLRTGPRHVAGRNVVSGSCDTNAERSSYLVPILSPRARAGSSRMILSDDVGC